MAQAESAFSKARVEAFSDGVLAVIITIMVLDLKAPESDDFAALVRLWPSFAIYLVSFAFVAIYWINHHAIMMAARQATVSLIWANYAALQFACGVAFTLTYSTIVAQRRDDAEFMAAARARRMQNRAAIAVYGISILVAAVSPVSALALFVAVAVAYVVPGLFNEAPLPRSARSEG